jgi:hypothetical protein
VEASGGGAGQEERERGRHRHGSALPQQWRVDGAWVYRSCLSPSLGFKHAPTLRFSSVKAEGMVGR